MKFIFNARHTVPCRAIKQSHSFINTQLRSLSTCSLSMYRLSFRFHLVTHLVTRQNEYNTK